MNDVTRKGDVAVDAAVGVETNLEGRSLRDRASF
jgi:hypothetical protein